MTLIGLIAILKFSNISSHPKDGTYVETVGKSQGRGPFESGKDERHYREDKHFRKEARPNGRKGLPKEYSQGKNSQKEDSQSEDSQKKDYQG